METAFSKKVNTHYIKLKKDIEKKIELDKPYEYVFDKNYVELYLDGKFCMKCEYGIMGMYNIGNSIWYWGWGISFIDFSLVKFLDNVTNFEKILDKEYSKFDRVEAEELHYVITNSSFYISNNNIDKIIRLCLYLTKGLWYFPIKRCNDDGKTCDKIEYIIVTKIVQFN